MFRSRDKGEAQVRKIVEAGITTFVCLQVCNVVAEYLSNISAMSTQSMQGPATKSCS